MLRGLISAGLGCLATAVLLPGCSSGGGQQPEFAGVVASAEAKTRGVQSVTVSIAYRSITDPGPIGNGMTYWQAPDRVRSEKDGKIFSIIIADKLYWSRDASSDRFLMSVASTRQSDQGKIWNFPVPSMGSIADRASAITFDGTEYTATVPVGDKSVTATMRISDGYIVWIRILTPDSETTYELSEFNTSPPVDAPPPEKVDVIPRAPSCSTPTTAPPTSTAGSGTLEFCMMDATTR